MQKPSGNDIDVFSRIFCHVLGHGHRFSTEWATFTTDSALKFCHI